MFSLANIDDGLISEYEEEDLQCSSLTQIAKKSENGLDSVDNNPPADSATKTPPKVLNNFTLPIVGEKVTVSRSDGQIQEAIVTKMSRATDNLTQQNNDTLVSVEWTENDGCVKGKTVDISKILLTKDCQSNESVVQTASSSNNSLDKSAKAENILDLQAKCDHCGQSFKNKRGVITHIAKKHPLIANDIKLKKLTTSENIRTPDQTDIIKSQINDWSVSFNKILCKTQSSFDPHEFDETTKSFLLFLREMNSKLPGPKHPATRFYKMRQKNKSTVSSKGATKSSNPTRANKIARERRKELYQYEVAQYYYYNRRRKVVQSVMNANQPKNCPAPLSTIENHFKAIFEANNDHVRDVYETSAIKPDKVTVDIKSVHKAIKSTSLDTSPGPDGVLSRTVKQLDISHIIKCIAEILLKFAYIPKSLREGKTILIFKGKGSADDLSSWRPITMYSILRRIIEKVFDSELRTQLHFHTNQRGFVNGLPGCHINTRLIDAILKDAKLNKNDVAIAFLDVTGAFDNIGHNHIMNSLQASGVSTDISRTIQALLCFNTVKISAGFKLTNPIEIHRGVPQGGPLSSTLFNLAINHLYKEFCDSQLSNEYGYKLNKNQDAILLTGFADDQAVTCKSIKAAERIIDGIQRKFKEIGLQVNPAKSTSIFIKKGILRSENINLEDGSRIVSITENETIKYLGCKFTGELTVDENLVKKLHENINKLTVSNLLKPDQKLNILNQYIFPTITYPLQTAPLVKLSPTLLEGIDVMIRRSTKAIVGLPANTSSAMLYAPRRFRGLGLLRCSWEAPLQHLSIAQKLAKISDAQFQPTFNFKSEVEECAKRLNLDGPLQEDLNVKKLRRSLRENSFDEWTKCKWQGIGVCHFKETPKCNEYLCDRKALSSSEWTNSIKLNINYAPLRGVPGNNTGDVGNLCRKCGREPETPAHVLGHCPNNMLLVTRRHHNVKHKIIEYLEEKEFTCYEEVHCIDDDGSSRFCDIVAFPKNAKNALIIDPTIRYETNDPTQGDKIHMEKEGIYKKCISFLQEKFHPSHGVRNYEVRGLWFGSRGSIPNKTALFFDEIGIDRKKMTPIVETIILDSLGIINHHIY